jgi:hypothetical protein
MKKIKKYILLAITLVIVGLLITSTISIPATKINKAQNKIKIEKLQNELKTETIRYTSYNDRLKIVPQTAAIGEFPFEGDQLHPAFDLSDAGGYMAAYQDEDFEAIMWTFTNENAVYYNIEGGDYPSIKLWDGTRFFGTLVPDYLDDEGGVVYLFETHDPTNYDNYSLVGWNWNDNGWSDIIDIELACDDSKEAWEWGFVSLVASTTYGDGVTDGPFISYPTSADGYATMSWYIGLDGCAHTDNTIDHVSYKAYAVYDFLDPEDDTWKTVIRLDYYDDWDREGTAYVYTGDSDLQHPAVAANDGDLLVVMEADAGGDKDIICFYGKNLQTLGTSVIVETGDDEQYPDIAHLNGDTYVCTYTKNGNIYGVITEDAGQSWGEPFQLNDNNGAVLAEYKYSDISSNGLQAMWQEDGYDSDIWYGASSGNEPPQAPTINGPSSGRPNRNYDFTVSATDPEGDDVYYYADWGDGTNSGFQGPYASGTTATLSKTWTGEQEFTITVRAKDSYGNIGPESTFAFSTPKNKAIMWNFLENFPLLSQILKALFL